MQNLAMAHTNYIILDMDVSFKGMGNQTSNIKKVHIRTSTCIYNLSLKNHAKFKLNLCYKEEMCARADTGKLK